MVFADMGTGNSLHMCSKPFLRIPDFLRGLSLPGRISFRTMMNRGFYTLGLSSFCWKKTRWISENKVWFDILEEYNDG